MSFKVMREMPRPPGTNTAIRPIIYAAAKMPKKVNIWDISTKVMDLVNKKNATPYTIHAQRYRNIVYRLPANDAVK